MKVSFVIPTYNERKNVKKIIPRIFGIFRDEKISGEVIIVDDNSPDRTGQEVKFLQKKYRNLKLLEREGKLGLASAVLDGIKLARGDFIGVMDADFSHPPEKIPAMLKGLKNSDIVVGSRHTEGGDIRGWSWKRKFISRGATLLARPLTSVKDPVSGFFFMKRGVVENVKLNPRGFKILLEILVKGKYKSVQETGFVFVNRKAGKSKMGGGEIWNYFRHVMGLWWWRIRN